MSDKYSNKTIPLRESVAEVAKLRPAHVEQRSVEGIAALKPNQQSPIQQPSNKK